jgi:prepilin-type processing-associated H-X9-DG protein
LGFDLENPPTSKHLDPIIYYHFSKRTDDVWKWKLKCPVRRANVWQRYEYNKFPMTLEPIAHDLMLAGHMARNPTEPRFREVSESQVVNPADTIAYTELVAWRMLPLDTNTWVAEYPRPAKQRMFSIPDEGSRRFGPAGYPPNRAVNQLFCDGHVEHIYAKQINADTDAVRRRWFIDNQPHRELHVRRSGVP